MAWVDVGSSRYRAASDRAAAIQQGEGGRGACSTPFIRSTVRVFAKRWPRKSPRKSGGPNCSSRLIPAMNRRRRASRVAEADGFIASCREKYGLADFRPDVHSAGGRGAGAAFRADRQDRRAQWAEEFVDGHERRLRDCDPVRRYPCPRRLGDFRAPLSTGASLRCYEPRGGSAARIRAPRDRVELVATHPITISVSGPSRCNSRSIDAFVIEMHPAVGEKFSRARCRNTALPRPAMRGECVVIDLDNEIIEMVVAREPIAALRAIQPHRLVVMATGGIFAPGVFGPDRANREKCVRPRMAVGAPPQPAVAGTCLSGSRHRLPACWP